MFLYLPDNFYFYFIFIFILLTCMKATKALIHRVSNYPDLLLERREEKKKFILFSQIKYRENNIITSIFNYNITFKQNYIAERI